MSGTVVLVAGYILSVVLGLWAASAAVNAEFPRSGWPRLRAIRNRRIMAFCLNTAVFALGAVIVNASLSRHSLLGFAIIPGFFWVVLLLAIMVERSDIKSRAAKLRRELQGAYSSTSQWSNH